MPESIGKRQKVLETEFKTLEDAARYARSLFTKRVIGDGYAFKPEMVMSEDPVYSALSDMIREHISNLDEDSIYEYTVDAIDHIIEENMESADDERIDEWADSDTDVYTSDLTGWLNRGNQNVGYQTEALENFGETDGFKVLQQAQMLARQEIYKATVDTLAELINNEDDGSEDE